ncbi:MAG: alanine racemase [Candidatus Komeilibacteria bacterium CG11_big_fil_rev_8_21_14_0_20_36_20]|uniref:Alanine racemase n=1 Tax=Candidatus Komeilibacteria bacterium CG11_big_fil_rev_8_21_14_0_20_36_20 TaxID=1974477 RepID=A0A2H0NBY6_9BACT|nr:MAG: alanine racemase [Candidatus Komeilibacteria bacterium CG11_big_fil_rev_8_21_14_0_20_36_20]PIR81982.1 MAG: alanine racemase [Candidatus Komeilibacteria bacterium CG10_big_fil_rev_8_21_14_0_10_36_65]PJC55520.1 MAG: alanine racemase [Candidatus Komeilibacteria bacterium CG_4_9_14_0_2_um_filter_36_13]
MPLTWIEIDSQNLAHNIQQFKKIAPQSQIWPVIKSNAYGHGFQEIAGLLDQNQNIDGLMVVNLQEALKLKEISSKPIMVLSYFDREERSLQIALDEQISLPVYDLDTANYLNNFAKKTSKKFLVNIKIDTGTARLGFRVGEAVQAINYIKGKKYLTINSIFTHYADSEAEDQNFIHEQLDSFRKIINKFPLIKIHSACSAAAVGLPQTQMDLIRLGLALYGLWPSQSTSQRGKNLKIDLKPVLAFKTKIIQLKELKQGESVGYDRSYICPQDCRIAVLPVGYNEGYSRLLSNQAEVLIKGQRCPVRGNICMNLTMVELPTSLNSDLGETVILLGNDGQERITAEELSSLSKTINYEVVTRINPLLPRVII